MGQEVWLQMCFHGKLRCNVHPSVSHVCKQALTKHLYYLPLLAAPAETLTKHRSFSLTSHQLRALTQLAGTLLGFERAVRELLTDATSLDITAETPDIKGTTYLGFHIMDIDPIRFRIPPFVSPTGIEEVEFLDIP